MLGLNIVSTVGIWFFFVEPLAPQKTTIKTVGMVSQFD